MATRAFAARRSRLLIYSAASLLVVYLALLLGTTYYSQRQLREAAHASLHVELQKRASALSYFYSERRADISRLTRDPAVTTFFTNRALGMSMEYGLGTSLLKMRDRVREMESTRQVDKAPIYRRIVIQDMDGEIMVDEGASAGEPKFWEGAQATWPETPELLVAAGAEPAIYVAAVVTHHGARVAVVLAQVDHRSVINGLVRRQGEAADYVVDLARTEDAERGATPTAPGRRDAGPDWHVERIPDTPFEISLAERSTSGGELLASEGYFYALAVLAAALLGLLALMAWQIHARERALIASYEALADTNARLRKSQKQLVRSEKMASLGTLAAGVAHEINNPIGLIQGNLAALCDYQAVLVPLVEDYRDFVRARAAEEPELAERWEQRLQGEDLDFMLEDLESLLTDTTDGGRRVADIVAGLRSFAHGEESRDEPIDLNECVAAALSLAGNELKYKAEVEQRLGELPTIRGNPGQITQVLVNLLVNAAQAIEGHGHVWIETLVERDNLLVRVRDDGPGIAAEHLDQLFTPFFTTKEVGKGTGLGLSISQGIIESHGGVILAASTPGQGTLMTVLLPIEQAEAANAATPEVRTPDEVPS